MLLFVNYGGNIGRFKIAQKTLGAVEKDTFLEIIIICFPIYRQIIKSNFFYVSEV